MVFVFSHEYVSSRRLPGTDYAKLINSNSLEFIRIVYEAISYTEIHLILTITLEGKQDFYNPHFDRRKRRFR